MEQLTHQTNCLRLAAEQMAIMSKAVQKVSSDSTLTTSALVSAKRDMVQALKFFDPKLILVNACNGNTFVYELDPTQVADDIAKLGIVGESGKPLKCNQYQLTYVCSSASK